ncbi:hypothetical protein PVAP13_5NG162400 [Panicum virgatum]|uniref:Uncharacterized protein n=1 Tax=Panicum virgatum TaxID=38727 RepID=A0A8T0RR76_PANVG|nr:hypothetical protein PVAP13_5NG162400 [Panicum virgatum]
MARSAKMMAAAALLVLAVAAATAEARNIKTADKKQADDAAVQPQTFPPFDRLGGGMPGGSSSLPGTCPASAASAACPAPPPPSAPSPSTPPSPEEVLPPEPGI